MANILVRGVPGDVHAALQRKAEHRNQSLQQYLASELRLLAERRSVTDVLDGIEAQRDGRVGLSQAVRDVSDGRERG